MYVPFRGNSPVWTSTLPVCSDWCKTIFQALPSMCHPVLWVFPCTYSPSKGDNAVPLSPRRDCRTSPGDTKALPITPSWWEDADFCPCFPRTDSQPRWVRGWDLVSTNDLRPPLALIHIPQRNKAPWSPEWARLPPVSPQPLPLQTTGGTKGAGLTLEYIQLLSI